VSIPLPLTHAKSSLETEFSLMIREHDVHATRLKWRMEISWKVDGNSAVETLSLTSLVTGKVGRENLRKYALKNYSFTRLFGFF
jgi:hypothetical protein